MMRNQVEVATATVSLRTLVIGERQVTAGVIRQIPREWWDSNSDPAPWVRFGCGVAGRCDAKWGHHHFLWVNHDGELRQWTTEPFQRPVVQADLRSDGMTPADADWETVLQARIRSAMDDFNTVEQLPYVYAAGMR